MQWIYFSEKLGFEIRHIHWIFWEPNTLIRSPYIWVDNLPHDTEWKPKQTLWPGLDVVSAESGVSVASGLIFGMSPDVSVDVPGLTNIFLYVDVDIVKGMISKMMHVDKKSKYLGWNVKQNENQRKHFDLGLMLSQQSPVLQFYPAWHCLLVLRIFSYYSTLSAVKSNGFFKFF